jgi:hypothetical protein
LLPPFSQEQSDVLLAEAALQRITDLLEAVPDPCGGYLGHLFGKIGT